MGNSHATPREVLQAVTDGQLKILAQLKLTNVPNEEAAKQLNMTVYQVRKVQEKPEFQDAIRNLSDEMVRTSALIWKGAMGKLIPKALSVLESNLEKDKLEAVKIILTSIGLDKVEANTSSGTVQVILPAFPKTEKEIVVNEN